MGHRMAMSADAAATVEGRYLIVTASMGAGHDQVARELATRLAAHGADTKIVDLIDVLPMGIGRGLRSGYAGMLRTAPWLYEGIFRVFFVPREHVQPSTSPLVVLGARRLAPLIEDYRPTAVVSTFHLAGQVVGRLRARRQLSAPGVVFVTDAVAHALWLDAGNDLFLCVYPHVAADAHRRTGRPALAPGPLLDPRFGRIGDAAAGRAALQIAPGEDAVLVSTGSWGVGDALRTARLLAGVDGVRPVVLCGRNEELQRAVGQLPGCVGLGWRDDLPDLFAAAAVLVDNAAGSTCMEAFAAGLPVVTYRPIPGHGRAGVAALAEAGLVVCADDDAELLAAVRRLRSSGPERAGLVERTRALFADDPAVTLAGWMDSYRAATPQRRPDPRTLGSRGPGQ